MAIGYILKILINLDPYIIFGNTVLKILILSKNNCPRIQFYPNNNTKFSSVIEDNFYHHYLVLSNIFFSGRFSTFSIPSDF